jgi:hypothetical protein
VNIYLDKNDIIMSFLAATAYGAGGTAGFLLTHWLVAPFNNGNPGIAVLPYDILGACIGAIAFSYLVLRVVFSATKQDRFHKTFKSFIVIAPTVIIGIAMTIGGMLADRHIYLLAGSLGYFYGFASVSASYLMARYIAMIKTSW